MNGAEDIPITNGTTPERPCGITSLLPSFSMSCRGRAEAFARRLQSRLRTLGTQSVDIETTNENESIIQSSNSHAWISTSLDSEVVTSIQPPLRQISHEADSFFDFDCEPESPGSPADECEYSRLVETASITPNDFASESGYICSSPLSLDNENHDNSHSSSNSPYFDPESSEIDQKSLPTDYYDCDESKTDDILNSTVIVNGHDISNDNSESVSDSLPPSQESTSTNTTIATPSSLTFNTDASSSSDNTLQDIIINELSSQYTDLKSTNQSDHQNHEILINSEIDKQDLSLEKPNLQNLHLENGFSSEVNTNDISNLEIPIQKITEASPEKESQSFIKNEESFNSKKHLSIGGDTDDEDDCRPQRVQRSSSLKSGKTPPGTPGRKKIVRFADVLGLDLADIKTFLDEIPTIPKSAYEDLEIIETESLQPPIQLGPRLEKILMPLFQQPGGLPNFLDIVRDKQVSLENAIVSDAYNLTITGCVRVRNLDFHKSVHIRYTLDMWKSFADLKANYVDNSCDGFSDKFSFILFGNSLTVGQRLEFAVRFHCKGQLYWDNNFGANYCFQCLPASNTSNLMRTPIASTTNTTIINTSTILNPTDPWCSSFY